MADIENFWQFQVVAKKRSNWNCPRCRWQHSLITLGKDFVVSCQPKYTLTIQLKTPWLGIYSTQMKHVY